MSTNGRIETPSGKGAGDENFPVGSFLLPRNLRPHIAKFYAFARAIDDIADNPELPADEKLTRLTAMENAMKEGAKAGIQGLETADAIHHSLVETGISTNRCSDLVDAFRQDAVKSRYNDWDDLMGYCQRSAAPVGQYLLDLHGEDPASYEFSDALCNALQVINHLQDCRDDYQEMDRVYLPENWMKAEQAANEDLNKSAATNQLRRVFDQCLDATEDLLVLADKLPGALKSRRLAMESAVIVNIAHKLAGELRHRDPLAEHVELTKFQLLTCTFVGILKGVFP